MDLFQIVIIAVMLFFNSIFAAYELALASISVEQLRIMRERKAAGAAAAVAMKERMEASLAVVQIGITLVGAVAAATGGAGAEENLSPWLTSTFGLGGRVADLVAIIMVVLPLAAITIIAGELVPKTFALRNAEWVCLKLSPLMQGFSVVVYPAVVTFEWITKKIVHLVSRAAPVNPGTSHVQAGLNELRAHAHALRASRIIGDQQERIILGAEKLSTVKVKDILVPPQDIVMLWMDGQLSDHLIAAHLDAHTRLLVSTERNNPQSIVGYVTVKELLFLAKTHPQNPHLREITRQVLNMSPDMTISEAFGIMMKEHVHLAVVRDDAGVLHGMITLEDLLEEIVGDIQDEFDRLPGYITSAGRQWIVGGSATFDRIRAALARPDFAADTPATTFISDWITRHLDRSPKGGDTLEIDGCRILVRKVRRNRVLEALIDPMPGAASPVPAPGPSA